MMERFLKALASRKVGCSMQLLGKFDNGFDKFAVEPLDPLTSTTLLKKR